MIADSTNEANHEKAIAKRETNMQTLLKPLIDFINSILSFALTMPENIFNMIKCFIEEIPRTIKSVCNYLSFSVKYYAFL